MQQRAEIISIKHKTWTSNMNLMITWNFFTILLIYLPLNWRLLSIEPATFYEMHESLISFWNVNH